MRPRSSALLATVIILVSSCSNDTIRPLGQQGCTITAATLSFGNSTPGSCTATQIIAITNLGSSTLTGSVGATCGDFEIVSGSGGYSLAFGQAHTITARFCPQSAGDKSCLLETGATACSDILLTGRGGAATDCQVTRTGLNFGTAAVGVCSSTQSFIIQNSGTGTLTGTVGESCPDFEITAGAGAYTLTAGQTLTVTVRFCPQSEGDKLCTIDTGLGDCSDVTVVGRGVLPSQCDVSTGSLAFGSVNVGGCSSNQSFTISNPGTASITGSVSESCPDFEITSGGGAYALGSGQSRTVTVRFCPQSVGDKSCTIETGNAVCGDVSLTGRGEASTRCQVTPAGLSFGTVTAGNCSATQGFLITNPSNLPLPGLISESCPDFEITVGSGGFILGPGQSRSVTVRFCPQSAGDKTCTIGTGSSLCSDVTVTGTGGP